MKRSSSLSLTIALVVFAAAAVLVTACGDDDESGGGDAATQTPPQFTRAPTPPPPTPLDRIECDVPVPDIALEAGGETQAGLPIQMEWAGPDCTYGGAGHDFDYFPDEPLTVRSGEEPRLTISETPSTLDARWWRPYLENATQIASGETAVPMSVTNQGRRSVAEPLDAAASADQLLPLGDLEPGEYGIELFGSWPDGVSVYSFIIVVE